MTDYAKLIAEAEVSANNHEHPPAVATAELLRRLAAAVRELAPPEGWVIAEYARQDGEVVLYYVEDDTWGAFGDPTCYPTAAAAMAALDKEPRA